MKNLMFILISFMTVKGWAGGVESVNGVIFQYTGMDVAMPTDSQRVMLNLQNNLIASRLVVSEEQFIERRFNPANDLRSAWAAFGMNKMEGEVSPVAPIAEPVDVHSLKYAGEDENSVYIMINESEEQYKVTYDQVIAEPSIQEMMEKAAEINEWIEVK